MFAFLIPILFAAYLGGLMDYPCEIPNCANHCLVNTTGTNCEMGQWNCLCFADIFLDNFDQCATKWCTKKEYSGAFCQVADQCAYYNVSIPVGPYSTAMTSSASLVSSLSGTATSGSAVPVETTTMLANTSFESNHTVSTRVTTSVTSTIYGNASVEDPASSGNKTAMHPSSLANLTTAVSGNASIQSVPPVLDGPPTSSVLSTHVHSSTAPTLSKTPPETTETSTATASGLGATSNPANAAPAAATTTKSSAVVVASNSPYKIFLGALVAVGALMAGL